MSIFNIRVQSDGDTMSVLSVTEEAPVLPKKIVFIGDSNTATRPTNGISQADTYSQKIGNARGFGTVVNAGIGGQTAVQMLARFQTDVLDQHPDYIHIDGGINGALAGGLTAAQHGAAVRGMAQMCQD